MRRGRGEDQIFFSAPSAKPLCSLRLNNFCISVKDMAVADHQPQPQAHAPNGQTEQDAMDVLRGLLLGDDRAQVAALSTQVDDLSAQIHNDEALIERVNPILGPAIKRSIQDSRDEMIEALYPIIGQLVVRAVTEAMRDLARTIDARMRRTISPSSVARRIQAQVSGVSGADVMLRDVLPFEISEIFLIHRESGLLLHHISAATTAGENTQGDSDIISGMLTAISEFVRDAFGTEASEREGADLDEIQYGDASILLETGRHAYIAVVIDGVEPAGFRAQLRHCVQAFNLANKDLLQAYNGNSAALRQIDHSLAPLQTFIQPKSTETTITQNPSSGAGEKSPISTVYILAWITWLALLAVTVWLIVWLIVHTA